MDREAAGKVGCTNRCCIAGDLVQWCVVSYLKLRSARNDAELGMVVLVGCALGQVAQVLDRCVQFATEWR